MQSVITRDRLFDVQRRALEESQDKLGFAFFMEQGLGKTLTTWQEYHEKVTRDLADVLIVVCPRSLRGAWRDEAEEFGYPYPVNLVESDKKVIKFLEEHRSGSIHKPVAVVMHYEQVLTHGTRIFEWLMEHGRRVYIALDESVRIKKPSSVIGERLYLLTSGQKKKTKGGVLMYSGRGPKVKVSAGAAFRRVLSGTPAPQGPDDLWAQFRFLGQMEKTPHFVFRHTYCKMGGFMGKKVVGAQNLDILRQRTGHYAFRAKKVDWTDLPEKLWAKPRDVDLTKEQRQAYLEIMNEFVLELGPEDFITVEMAITVKNKLQQICSGWIYDNDKQVRELVPLADNPKLQEARSVIEETPNKILIFYFFQPTRRYLAQLAEEMGVGHVFLESGLSDSEFDARKKTFNTDDSVQVAFCQTDAVKEGHTLLGTEANPCFTTLFLENTYSLYARKQAEDRNHRHGQRNPVTYIDISTSREDREIIKALQRKEELQEALLSEFTAYR